MNSIDDYEIIRYWNIKEDKVLEVAVWGGMEEGMQWNEKWYVNGRHLHCQMEILRSSALPATSRDQAVSYNNELGVGEQYMFNLALTYVKEEQANKIWLYANVLLPTHSTHAAVEIFAEFVSCFMRW